MKKNVLSGDFEGGGVEPPNPLSYIRHCYYHCATTCITMELVTFKIIVTASENNSD